MKYIILVLTAIVAHCASWEIPPPTYPEECEVPDCSIISNRFHEKAVFAHPDPNRYYQCVPFSTWEWRPMERWCICGTVFNPKSGRCSYWWDEGWEPMCEWSMPPLIATCERHYDGWLTPKVEPAQDDDFEEETSELEE